MECWVAGGLGVLFWRAVVSIAAEGEFPPALRVETPCACMCSCVMGVGIDVSCSVDQSIGAGAALK